MKPSAKTKTGQKAGRAVGRMIGGVIGGVFDLAAGTLGLATSAAFRLPGLSTHKHRVKPGSKPGIDHLPEAQKPPEPGGITITRIDYGPDVFETHVSDDVDAQLSAPRPEGASVRWYNIDGLHPYVVKRFSETYDIHPLAAEDILHTPQRPALEHYNDHLFMLLRMMRLIDRQLIDEQVSLLVRPDLIITFQEKTGDVWQPIRDRLRSSGSRLRTHPADYLAYALMDALVDHCFPILEQYGDLLEEIEAVVVEQPDPALLRRIHGIRRELILLRRVLWPTREVASSLIQDETGIITDYTRTYMRDVYEHAVQAIDLVETYRDNAGGMADLYMSAVSNRMNEIMKVLTIMASLFIPITFFAGVYGMNFEHIPELGVTWAYPAFWAVCGSIVTGMLWWFWRRGWIGRG